MLSVKINEDELHGSDLTQEWITNQISKRRKAQQLICVRVRIQSGDADLVLQTPECAKFGGVARGLTNTESKLVAAWHEFGMQDGAYQIKGLLAFLALAMDAA